MTSEPSVTNQIQPDHITWPCCSGTLYKVTLVYANIQQQTLQTSHVLHGTRNTRPCITGHPVPGADPLYEVEGGDEGAGVPELLFVYKLLENRFEVLQTETKPHRQEGGYYFALCYVDLVNILDLTIWRWALQVKKYYSSFKISPPPPLRPKRQPMNEKFFLLLPGRDVWPCR